MSKDSSPTYIHFHHPRLADLFEDFNRPHTSPSSASNANNAGPASQAAANGSSESTMPSFLPIEDIYVDPQHQPVNPEDEDDVVPDQHAAFGITRAMDSRGQVAWRDLGLEELMRGARLGGRKAGGGKGPMKRIMCLR